MKAGDRIKIFSARDKSYTVGTVVEVDDETVKYKDDEIKGHFIVKDSSGSFVCDSCGCDPVIVTGETTDYSKTRTFPRP